MKTFCKVSIMGAVGNDPEKKYTKAGAPVVTFSMATERKVKEETFVSWHSCVSFGKTADIVEKWVRKGSKLYVYGTISYYEYETKGVRQKMAKIVINEIALLGEPSQSQAKKQMDFDRPPPSQIEFEDDLIPF